MDDDPFDSILNLEDTFYKEGYELGVTDGSRAGYLEGRAFGIEKGFEKFLDMTRMYGRAIVWTARLRQPRQDVLPTQREAGPVDDAHVYTQLATLPANPRLEKHIQTLLALVDPSTLSMENNEESVAEFDDRLNRAKAKVKVIERIIGETSFDETLPATGRQPSTLTFVQSEKKFSNVESGDGSIEDVDMKRIKQ